MEQSGVHAAEAPIDHSRATPMLDVVGLSLGYKTPAGMSVAVRDVSFSVRRGETAILLGPSGCGKSTILKSVAGFIKPLQGTVTVANRKVNKPGPDRAVVFQEFDQLFPWRTVLDNIAYPLRATGKATRAEAQDRANLWLGVMRLEAAARKFPHQLSGGMKQRVAIARALALEPAVLLMDEPFGALDPQTRLRLQLEVIEVVKRTAATVLFVTHSIAEAALVGHDIIILDGSPSSVASIVDARSVCDPASQEALEVGRQVAESMGQEASHVIGD
ncbi:MULTISPECIES: ABC transporter ATP-binding protein [unclassified Bradyrhizobium]|uniref:ABC transporter ATP-binding protein n=1 Tax=unclassified Bradyrhizobium TaxID=2631580 RepID=UPI0028E21296|nr:MULTISPECIES: ABC transporter ATP-binding protein [unclassified Bradyrhizobium]